MKRHTAVLALTAAAGMCLAATGPAIAQNPATGHTRGTLVSEPIRLQSLTKEQAAQALTAAEFPSGSVEYGVDVYWLAYRTVDPWGRPTTASGLLTLPRNKSAHPKLVSFDHGTESFRGDAPSTGDSFSSSPALTFAASGFAAVTPDYLGLGSGPGTHPWMDIPSETTASLDMLRAARRFMVELGRTPQRQVLASGFSQGASAALGLARALEAGADPDFTLQAVAPISGAYDFRDAEIPAALEGKQIPGKYAVIYLTYMFVAWNRLHHVYDSPGEVFKEPYASRVDQLFNSNTPGQVMFAGLPDSLDQLLTDHGLDLLRHPDKGLSAALDGVDSVCTGRPLAAPIRLYYASGDEQAVNANTDHCRQAFAAAGLKLKPIDLGPHDYEGSRHLGTAVSGTTAVLSWFTSLPSAGS